MSPAASASPAPSDPLRGVTRLLALLLLAGAVWAAAVGCGGGPPPPDDPVVATVDGRDVHRSAVDAMRAELRLLDGEEPGADEVLRRAAEREALRGEAEQLGIKVDEAAVARRRADLVRRRGGDAALQAALREAGMTAGQLRSSLEAAELFAAVARARYPGLRAGSAEARRFYRRHRDAFRTAPAVDLGAIFVRNEGIAGNALKRLRAGRPFEEVARQFSIDPELKHREGRLGWTVPGSLPGELGDVVKDLAVGEVSAPTAGGGGVWVFKVFGRRGGEVTPFSGVRDELVARLTARKRAAALQEWLREAGGRVEIPVP